MGQPGVFDLNERYERLSENGDPLVKLAATSDFAASRPTLATAPKRSNGSKGGRRLHDPVFSCSRSRSSRRCRTTPPSFALRPSGQIRDGLSFMRFLGLGFEDGVPDAKTVWLFREQATRAGAIDASFAAFVGRLEGKGHLAMSVQMIEASIITAPRQRKTDAGKAALREGRIPEARSASPKKLG